MNSLAAASEGFFRGVQSFLVSDIFWTFLAAVGTVGAFIAVVAQIYQQDRRQRKLEDSIQAELVSAWIDASVQLASGGTTIIVNNAGQLPIYRVFIILVAAGNGPPSAEMAAPEADASFVTVRVVPPGRHRYRLGPRPGWGARSTTAVEIAFTDSRNKHWVRRQDGQLERLSTDAWTLYDAHPYARNHTVFPVDY